MTETASGATSRGGGKAHKGLTIQRIHTREGVHPYDEVTWERRDVVMTNWRDGTVNFEQHGVEFPDFWSVNAANIVTPSTSAARSARRSGSGASSSSSTASSAPTPRQAASTAT